VTDHYHVRKTRFWIWPYTVYYGGEYPRCTVVSITMSLRGARRAIKRDKARRARPLPPVPPIVLDKVM
jgi:hypothetical protein